MPVGAPLGRASSFDRGCLELFGRVGELPPYVSAVDTEGGPCAARWRHDLPPKGETTDPRHTDLSGREAEETREMTTFVALLRAVNVGGTAPLQMEELRRMLERMGLTAVRSLRQSGNLVFDGPTQALDRVERRLETESIRTLDRPLEFFVRTALGWRTLIERNPFVSEARVAPEHLQVTLLKGAPPLSAWQALKDAVTGPERIRGAGREAYIVYPDGIGRSRLAPALIERKLGTRGTSRNWNTVLGLQALTSEASPSRRSAGGPHRARGPPPPRGADVAR